MAAHRPSVRKFSQIAELSKVQAVWDAAIGGIKEGMETITVTEVSGPNENGWYTVKLDDGREAATKDKAVAEAAFQVRETPTEATIGTTTKGQYTNHYLNAIAGVEGKKGKRSSNGSGSKGSAIPTQSSAEQDRARRWSFSAALELLTADPGYTFPPSAEELEKVEELAKSLLSKTSG